MSNTPADIPKTEPPTSAALPEAATPVSITSPQVSADEHSTEVPAETRPQLPASATNDPATPEPTIESSSKPPSSEERAKLPTETIESTPSGSISQLTTAMMNNEETSTPTSSPHGPTSETTTVSATEVSIVSIVMSSSESTPHTTVPVALNSEATQQAGTSNIVNPTTPADIRIIITSAASLTALAATESDPVISDIRELIIGDEITAEKPSSDTVTTLRLNSDVPDVENKTKSETYQNVDFIESNDITTDETPVKDQRKSKNNLFYFLIELVLQFLKHLVQAK